MIDTHQILASYKACLHAVVRRYLTVYILLSLCAGQYGRWSTDSCRVVSDNGATTHCVCTQLGHFSLLFVSDTALTISWSYSTNHEARVVLYMAWFVWPNYTITLCFRTSIQEMSLHLEPSFLQLWHMLALPSLSCAWWPLWSHTLPLSKQNISFQFPRGCCMNECSSIDLARVTRLVDIMLWSSNIILFRISLILPYYAS